MTSGIFVRLFLFCLNISISNKCVFLTESIMKDIHYPRVKAAADFILPQRALYVTLA